MDGSIKYDVSVDTSDARSQVSQLGQGLAQIGAQAAQAAQGGLSGLTAMIGRAGGAYVAAAAGVASLAGTSYQAFAGMEALKNGLAAATRESGGLSAQLERLEEVAKLPGLGFAEAIQGSASLQAAGLSAKQAEEALKGFGNGLARAGKGKAELESVVRALTQITDKGELMEEELMILKEAVPGLGAVLKETFGAATAESIREMGIGTEEFTARVTAALNSLPQVAGGAKNAMENLGDSWTKFSANVGAMVNEVATPAINLLADGLTWLANPFATAKAAAADFNAELERTGTVAATATELALRSVAAFEGAAEREREALRRSNEEYDKRKQRQEGLGGLELREAAMRGPEAELGEMTRQRGTPDEVKGRYKSLKDAGMIDMAEKELETIEKMQRLRRQIAGEQERALAKEIEEQETRVEKEKEAANDKAEAAKKAAQQAATPVKPAASDMRDRDDRALSTGARQARIRTAGAAESLNRRWDRMSAADKGKSGGFANFVQGQRQVSDSVKRQAVDQRRDMQRNNQKSTAEAILERIEANTRSSANETKKRGRRE